MTGHPVARSVKTESGKGGSRERTKSGGFSAPKEGTSLDERPEFVHPEGDNNSELPSQPKSRVLLHQSALITGSRSLEYVVLFLRPDVNIIGG